MKATSITVSVRYSRSLADGSHKTVELGCEASLNNGEETWQEAQTTLYRQLGEQMRYVWSGNSNGKQTQETPGESPAKPGNSPAVPDPNWCSEHSQEWKLRNGPHGSFRSHQIKGSKPAQWCNLPNK
jgi:hypothetical protein